MGATLSEDGHWAYISTTSGTGQRRQRACTSSAAVQEIRPICQYLQAAQRTASGRQRATRACLPLPPRGLRPKLDRSQLTDLALVHVAHLDALAHGQADSTTLYHAVAAAYTWSRVAELMGVGEAEMAEQLLMLESVLQRFKRTGRAGLSGPEYQTARRGVDVMDELARITDLPTAVAAAAWSEGRMARVHQMETV
jgi:hypothetical protein